MKHMNRLKSKTITKPEDPAWDFLVPEGYFEALPDRVLLRLGTAERAGELLREERSGDEGGASRSPLHLFFTATAVVAALLLALPLIFTSTLIDRSSTTLASRTLIEATCEEDDEEDLFTEDNLLDEWADYYYADAAYGDL